MNMLFSGQNLFVVNPQMARACFSIILLVLLLGQAALSAEQKPLRKFQLALPGYKFKFPADHFSHEDYKTEWWYYTGHLESKDGKRFGFELTFFRSGVPVQDRLKTGPWALNNVYLTHFALSDIDEKKFLHSEKMCRAGVGTAGAKSDSYKVWTENWTVRQEGNDHLLHASEPDYSIDLRLNEGKGPVIQGEDGVSQKAACVGCASHYYSFTRMPVSGKISVGNKFIPVTGQAWMDHEFGSNQLTADQVGWDWFSVQLDDNSELMLYTMRLANGGQEPNSSGTLIYADGKSKHLPLKSYRVEPREYWTSPHTGAKYPSKWHVILAEEKIDLNIEAELSDQELVSNKNKGGVSYWEGACSVSGSKEGKPIHGQAYVELTGYAAPLNKKI